MTDKYVLSIDPGKSSGISLVAYNDREIWLEDAWQFGGGTEELVNWVEKYEVGPYDTLWFKHVRIERDTVICEAFTARNTQGFSYTTDSLEPLPAIGALISLGLVDRLDKSRYRDPKYQYLVGGKDKADKKKRLHKFLKDSGFYVAPSAVDSPDADDVRSSIGHALAYLQREVKHRGVHDLVTKWIEEN